MTEFTVNLNRLDPYKNFKFRIKWDGKYVAGVSKVSALKRTTEVIEHREGGDPSTGRKSPGRTAFEPVTLERGLTHDHAFEEWANLVKMRDGNATHLLRSHESQKQIDLANWGSGAGSQWLAKT